MKVFGQVRVTVNYNVKMSTYNQNQAAIKNQQGQLVATHYGNFFFTTAVTDLTQFVKDFKANDPYEGAHYDLNSLLFNPTDKALYRFLSRVIWDEQQFGAEYWLPYKYRHIFEGFDVQSEARFLRKMLLLSGDVESNPGPVFSRPSADRYNDLRQLKLENAIQRALEKEKTNWKRNRKALRNAKIYTQCRDPEDVLVLLRSSISSGKIQAQVFNILGDTSKMKETADELNTNLNRVCDFLENSLPVIQNSMQASLLNTTTSLSNVKSDIVKLTVVLLLVRLLMVWNSHKLALALTLTFVLHVYGFDKSIISLVGKLKNKLVSSQGIGDKVEDVVYNSYFSTCGKIIFAAIAFICIKAIPGKKDWDAYIMRLDRIPKAIQGSGKIIDYCSEFFNVAMDQIKMMVLGKTREELVRANGLYGEIYEWAADVRKYLELEQRNKIDTDIEIATKVEELYKRGLRYQQDTLLDKKIASLVSTTLLPARELYHYVSSSPVKGGGPRMRPLCIWLIGESGVGKTEMVYPLCIDILREMGLVKKTDFHHQVYGRQVETEYWDGYKGQKIVIYDDAFQMKDDKTSPNPEIFEVIRSCNTFPQHLHMAALHDKNTFSSAEVMLYTTNDANVQLESITFPDAFYNRIGEFAYKVRPKLEYSIIVPKGQTGETMRKLDMDKVDKTKAIDLNVYEFQKIERDNQTDKDWVEVGDPIDYNVFSALVCYEWKEKKRESLNKLKFLEQYAIRAQVKRDVMTRAKHQGMLFPIGEEGERLIAEETEKVSKFMAAKGMNGKVTVHKEPFGDKSQKVQFYMQIKNNYNKQEIEEEKFEDCVKWNFDWFVNDIAAQITAGRDLIDIESDYAAEPEKFEDYLKFKQQRNISIWDKYRDRIQIQLEDTKSYLTRLKEEIVGIFTRHPYLTILGAIGVMLSAFALYQYFKESPEDTEEEPYCWKAMNRIFGRDVPWKDRKKFDKDVEEYHDMRIYEVGTSGDSKTNKAKIKRVEVANDNLVLEPIDKQLREGAKAQGCSDKAAFTLVVDLLQRNTYRLSYMKGDVRKTFGNCTFLRGWTFVIPYHFLQALKMRKISKDTIIYFSQSKQQNIIQIPLNHIFDVVNNEIVLSKFCSRLKYKNGDFRDCVMINLHSKMCHPHRDIVKHFVNAEDQNRLVGKFNGLLATFHEDEGELVRAYQWLQQIRPMDAEITIYLPEDGNQMESYTQRECYEYNAPTQTGDCGSIVGLFNHRMERKLMGMHIAGTNESYGYACPLTQELLEEGFEDLKKKDIKNISAQFYYETIDAIDTLAEPQLPEGIFVPLGKVEKGVGRATKTTIIPSIIHGKLSKPIMKPALLKPTQINNVMVDPLLMGLKKCGVETAVLKDIDVDAATMDVAQVVLTQHKSTLDRSRYTRILTYEEAVEGDQMDSMINGVARRTSPGYPYCLNNKGKPGKTRWLGMFEKYDFASDDAKALREDVEKLLDDCAKGKISNVFFVDTLKDERRDIEKVNIGKTRVFSAGPQHFVIAFRKFFLPFSAWLMHNRIDNEIAVGTNPYSIDWERIAKRLKMKGEHVVAGDFGNFDGSLVAQILWSIFWNVYVPWLDLMFLSDNEKQKCLKTALGLWAHLVHSVHIFDNNIYMWTHSQPSGNPFTVIINCLYNSTIMRIAWMKIMDKFNPKLRSMKWFRKYVSIITYGDDNGLNISDKVIQIFNQQTISEIMSEMKHEYTDETKQGTAQLSRKLESILFLKRGFKFSEELQRTVGPLKIEVIYEMLNWTRNMIDPNIVMMSNIETAFREIVFHGRDAYEKLRTEIASITHLLPEVPQILPYEQYLHDVEFEADELYEF